MTYYPKRPVKSFMDLEVYQKLLAISVAVVKQIKSDTAIGLARDLPAKIATAHSCRFSDFNQAVNILENAMLDCNLLIVRLEQYRDIENKEVETEFFEEQIKTLLSARLKILHLQQSWKKFHKDYQNAK